MSPALFPAQGDSALLVGKVDVGSHQPAQEKRGRGKRLGDKAPRAPRKCKQCVAKGRDGDVCKGRASGETCGFIEQDKGY
jgi:hypothetical protein